MSQPIKRLELAYVRGMVLEEDVDELADRVSVAADEAHNEGIEGFSLQVAVASAVRVAFGGEPE